MKLTNKFIVFVYYTCVILITVTFLSWIFGIIIGRILLEPNHKTRYYYIELIMVWGILLIFSFYIKYNFNNYTKKTILTYVEKHDNDYKDYNDLSDQIEKFTKFDIVIIIGFLLVYFNSYQHTQTEKFKLLNEDIGFFTDMFI
jgi:hypothetical protein